MTLYSRRRFLASGLVVCGAGAGCASSSPASRFYVLSPATATASVGVRVSVAPVSVPALVDRPQLVVMTNANEVRIDEFNRWASPLQDNLSRVIAGNLGPSPDAMPTGTRAGPVAQGDCRVEVQVQRMESVAGRQALLDASWVVRGAVEGVTKSGHGVYREPVADESYPALVAAHSRAVGRLSDDIAITIRSMAPAGRP